VRALRDRFPSPVLMGVVNVTPDSFSDGGRFFAPDAAITEAVRHAADGAVIVDIGGESTRPWSDGVSIAEELRRVTAVIEGVAERVDVTISIDTSKAAVAERALMIGARFVNDVTALSDPAMGRVVAEAGADLCLMHMLGSPRTMQDDPRYDNVVDEVRRYLAGRVQRAVTAGVAIERISVDPGIGFGKTADHNIALLRHIPDIEAGTGCPVLIGVSRKSFLGRLIGDPDRDRTVASVTAGVEALRRGAWALRVHDVGIHRDALRTLAAFERDA
jgi:dihydropteroate synthase